MNILTLENVVKQYHNHRAVDGVSFEVPKGSIFGLLGPNGAGKTSLIRIITTITAADSGRVIFDGRPLNSDHPSSIGYMPEERGLYKKMKVADQLIYLAQLKGMSFGNARDKLRYWMKKFEIESWAEKKIEELSKGMQQKIQFIATVMHDPKLLILDEPFSGLDPINTNLIKDEIFNLHQKGTTIIFSTHRMEQVEEICQEIFMINNGKKVLEGKVNEIKERFKENKYLVQTKSPVEKDISTDAFDFIKNEGNELEVRINKAYTPNDLLKYLIEKGVEIKAFHEILPTINDIFIKAVESNQ